MDQSGMWNVGKMILDGIDLADAVDDAQASSAAEAAAADARRMARQTSTNSRFMADELARLELICEAMWGLMKEKTGLTDEDLLAEMARLDLMDGKADGKKEKSGPVVCGKCGRPNSRRHDFCIYCGNHIRVKPFQ